MSRDTRRQAAPGPSLASAQPVPSAAPVPVERQICEPVPAIQARPRPSMRTLSRSPGGFGAPQLISLAGSAEFGSATAAHVSPPSIVRHAAPLVPTARPTVPPASNSMSRNTVEGTLAFTWNAPPTRW
jgi:hypothetical protein